MDDLKLEEVLQLNPHVAKSLPIIKEAIAKLAKLRAAGVIQEGSFVVAPKSLGELKNARTPKFLKRTFMLDRRA